MKKSLACLLACLAMASNARAIEANTVEVAYNGTTAQVTVAPNISSYVTIESGTSAHVRIVQSDTFAGTDATVDNTDGEIIYVLSGSSADGEFYMEGSFKATVELNGLTLTNPSGPAINIQDGKRIALSAKKGTVNTLADGPNEAYNGCYHCKGHTKLKGKGTLNVAGNSKHAIYSKEYIEVKNLTLNITAARKDGLHCKEYLLIEGGTVNISGTQDDGIQVELAGLTPTGATANHDNENTGNFYMTDGTLTIAGYQGKAIKADGTIAYSGGKQNFDTTATQTQAGIGSAGLSAGPRTEAVYDLGGRRAELHRNGVFVVKQNSLNKKTIQH